jgi:MPBQ/MSBQ methyltransferase
MQAWRSAEGTSMANNRQRILDFYDRAWHPLVAEYYGHSDYMNYGYWTGETETQAEASESLVGKLLSMIPDKKGRILDVACGRGASTRHLLRYYQSSDIVAINISQQQLKRASELAPGCTFILRDAARLEFPDCFFDKSFVWKRPFTSTLVTGSTVRRSGCSSPEAISSPRIY